MKKVIYSFVLGALVFGLVYCGGDDDGAYGPAGSGNVAGVGNHCVSDVDCQTGECYLGPGGGYCTTACQDEGSTSQCPVDTVCKPIQGGARRCLLICGSESACYGQTQCETRWCPQGSSCISVGGTDLWACEPDPV